jgi:chaperonin GroES
MKYKIIPLLDRLVVKPIQEETENELIIPDSAKEKPQKGEVIAVGPGKKDEPMIAKVGGTVLYCKGAGIALPQTDGWLMMKEGQDTIAILEPIAN